MECVPYRSNRHYLVSNYEQSVKSNDFQMNNSIDVRPQVSLRRVCPHSPVPSSPLQCYPHLNRSISSLCTQRIHIKQLIYDISSIFGNFDEPVAHGDRSVRTSAPIPGH